MPNLASERKIRARQRREAKELRRRKAELTRGMPKGYLAYMLIILSVVYIVDEITTNMGSSMQSEVIADFFVRGQGLDYNTGLASYTAMSAPLFLVVIFVPFYKSLADTYGRKLFLVLNTLCMGAGLAVCMAAPGPGVYLLGTLLINFVMHNDMQVMYVMECAPEKHRAKLTSLTKAVALLGVTLIPVLRDAFMGDDGLRWRRVYLVPALLAGFVGIAAVFLMRETPVFLRKRVEYLSMSAAERAGRAETRKKAADTQTGGVGRALRFILQHKQMRAVTFCAFMFSLSTGVINYYGSVMKTGGMTTAQITQAMYYIPPVNAAMTAAGGFITDILGRKRSAVLLSCAAFLGLTAFVLSADHGCAPVIVGLSYGLFIGGLWSVSDLLCLIIPGESTPTQLRASVLGTMSLLSSLGMLLSLAAVAAGMLFVGSIGTVCLALCLPFMLLSILLLITRIHETKGMDLRCVTGTEWD